MYETLSQDVNFNMLFSQHGHLTLAHSDRSLQTMVERAEVNRLLGVNSQRGHTRGDRRRCARSWTCRSAPPSRSSAPSITRPAASSATTPWSGATPRRHSRPGVEIHPYTEVTGITRDNGRVTGVDTSRGHIAAGTVISCVAGWSTLVCDLAGVELPI